MLYLLQLSLISMLLLTIFLLALVCANSALTCDGQSSLCSENLFVSGQILQSHNILFEALTKKAESDDYMHSEKNYKDAQRILQVMSNFSQTQFSESDEVVITLGKTGWGKSTTINLLDGAQFKVGKNGYLLPKDGTTLKTLMGSGNGSTTMFPVHVQTKFGKVSDLPGDEETRGIVAELINHISKKNMGRSLKKIKIMLVVPASVFTAEGSYGSQFKKILNSVDKFLGGVNKYKMNVIMLVNFAKRRPNELENVVENIQKCLNHQDRALIEYKPLLQELIKSKKIKLIAEPDSESEEYSVPKSPQWKQHSLDRIVQDIINLPSKEVKQSDFSVPYNPNLVPKLSSFLKIFLEKVKASFEVSFQKIRISGLELTFVKEFLKQIRNNKHLSLMEFFNKFKKHGYLAAAEVSHVIAEIELILQFIKREESNGAHFKNDWISQSLQSHITKVVEEIEQIRAIPKLNFRKKIEGNNLSVSPNSKISEQVEQMIKQLQILYEKLQRIKLEKDDQGSLFFEDQIQKVYDRTIQEPYEIEEQYIEYETQQKLYKVPKEVEEVVDVQKQRIAYKDEEERYKEKVPKTRKVPKKQTEVTETKIPILFGLLSQTSSQTVTSTVEVDQIYFEEEERVRKIKVPYTEYYTEKGVQKRIEQIEELRTEEVAIEKSRNVTLYRDKELFRDEPRRVFNPKMYEQHLRNVSKAIKQKQGQILQKIEAGEKTNLPYIPLVPVESCKEVIERTLVKLFEKWFCVEHQAFRLMFPLKNICQAKKEVYAD